MRLYFVILLGFIGYFQAFSQVKWVQLREEYSNDPLAFLSVKKENDTYYRSDFYGILEIKDSIQELCFDHNVGYLDTCITITPTKDTTIIFIKPQVYKLQEAYVHLKSIQEILLSALDSVEKHFLEDTTSFQAFHREQLTENGKRVFASEGLYHICKVPYTQIPKKDQVQLIQGHKNLLEMESDIPKYAKNTGSAHIMLLNDFAKFAVHLTKNRETIKQYNFRYAGSDTSSQNLICIAFSPKIDKKSKGLFTGKIFLEETTLAIVKITYQLSPKGIEIVNDFDWRAKVVMGLMGIKIRFKQFSASLNYQRHKTSNKYYLQKIQAYFDGTYMRKRKGFDVTLKLYSEMVVMEKKTHFSCPVLPENQINFESKLLELLKDAEYTIPVNITIEEAYKYFLKRNQLR